MQGCKRVIVYLCVEYMYNMIITRIKVNVELFYLYFVINISKNHYACLYIAVYSVTIMSQKLSFYK